MKTHLTLDEKPTYASIPMCQGNPKPRCNLVTQIEKVTCNRCRVYMGHEEV